VLHLNITTQCSLPSLHTLHTYIILTANFQANLDPQSPIIQILRILTGQAKTLRIHRVHQGAQVTLNNVSDYQTNRLFWTPNRNPNPSPFVS